MAGGAFAGWWSKMAPYYTKAYQEMWVGVGIMTFMYYKLSYGGERSSLLKSSSVVYAQTSGSMKNFYIHRTFPFNKKIFAEKFYLDYFLKNVIHTFLVLL